MSNYSIVGRRPTSTFRITRAIKIALGEPEDWRDLGPHLLSHDHADAEEEENQKVEGEYKDHASA